MKELDLYRFEFKKQFIGGYDKLDVLKKMQQLNSKYQELMQNQKEFYEGIIKDMQENGLFNTTKVIHVYADSNADVRPVESNVKENNTERKVTEEDEERNCLLNELNHTIGSMKGFNADYKEPKKEIEIRFNDNTTKVENKEIKANKEKIEEKVEEEIEEPSLLDDVEETSFFSYGDEDESNDKFNQDIIGKIDEIMSSSFEEIENEEEVEEEIDFTSAVQEIENIEKEIVVKTQELIEAKPKKRRERGAIRELKIATVEPVVKKPVKAEKIEKVEIVETPVKKRRERGAIRELKSSTIETVVKKPVKAKKAEKVEIVEEPVKKRRERGAIRVIEIADEETIAKKRAARRRKLQKAAAKKPASVEKADKPVAKKRRERGAIKELKND